jgi:hypothetical protein
MFFGGRAAATEIGFRSLFAYARTIVSGRGQGLPVRKYS